jgi:hypothetical protein
MFDFGLRKRKKVPLLQKQQLASVTPLALKEEKRNRNR